MGYLKNKSPSSVIQDGKITAEEAFIQQGPPRVNHPRIFGFTAFFLTKIQDPSFNQKPGKNILSDMKGRIITAYMILQESRHDTGKASFLYRLGIEISNAVHESYLSRKNTYLSLALHPPWRFLTHDGSGSRPVDHRKFRRMKLGNLKGSSVCTNISLFLLVLLNYGTLMETKLC